MPETRTTRHQREAEVISEKAADEIDFLLRTADVDDMAGWFRNHRDEIFEILNVAYHTNQSLAHIYLHGIADEAGVETDVFDKTFSEKWIWRSLGYVGWRSFGADLASGVPVDIALEQMIKRVHGSIFRHSYEGSRGTIMQTIKRSKSMIGYQRVSLTGTPCAFCAMLIGRGAVYKANMGQFRAHDSDRCTAEPRFRGQQNKPDDQAKRFAELWDDSGASSKSGKAAINAFRRAYERGNE